MKLSLWQPLQPPASRLDNQLHIVDSGGGEIVGDLGPRCSDGTNDSFIDMKGNFCKGSIYKIFEDDPNIKDRCLLLSSQRNSQS